MGKFSIVGRRMPRVDSLEKVTGKALYTGDIKLQGILYAKVLRSPYAHARILHIDISKAERLIGVKGIVTHKDAPKVLYNSVGFPPSKLSPIPVDQYIMDKKVRFLGEAVAVVAATSEEVAEEALDLIHVEYESLPAVFGWKDIRKGKA